MAYTFNDMGFLTNPQKAAAQELADLAVLLRNSSESPTPPLTMSQTKRAKEILDNLDALWRGVRRGINYSLEYYRHQALADLDSENP